MDAIKNAYYRSFQAVFNVAARCLYWRKPITVEGEGALSKAPELFKKKNHVKKVMIVTGRTVGKTIAPIAKASGQGRHRLRALLRGFRKPDGYSRERNTEEVPLRPDAKVFAIGGGSPDRRAGSGKSRASEHPCGTNGRSAQGHAQDPDLCRRSHDCRHRLRDYD